MAHLDEYYHGLSNDSMYTDDGLYTGLEIFLNLVHVLEPQKTKTINKFLANELPQIRDDPDFRQKAYKFLKKKLLSKQIESYSSRMRCS